MDDQPQGSGQHSRPFFYVQPPSQPYPHHHQQQQHWHMPQNPYLYGPPGGYNFGRPYLPPYQGYQYMQYPGGFVLPQQGQMHPMGMDYRRMFEPHYHLPPAGDIPFRQQYQQQQHYQHQYPPQSQHVQREMACSEVQTDPSDAIAKLIECLGKLGTGGELAAAERDGREKELDSGVASQSSGIFSPGEEKGGGAGEGSNLQSPAVMSSDSTAAVYDGESSRRSLEDLGRRGCWSVGYQEDMPLDSSSVHEEARHEALQTAVDDSEAFEKPKAEVLDKQSDESDICRRDADELLKWIVDTSTQQPLSPSPSEQQTCKGVTTSDKFSNADGGRTGSPDEVGDEFSSQILKLPFEKVLTSGALLGDSPVLCGGPPKPIRSGRLSSPVSPYYYPYLRTPSTHGRMSVLSPSLDELSSRDEMFSTDFEDMDLFPKRMYPSRMLTDVTTDRSPHVVKGAGDVRPAASKKFLCACCGTVSVAKGTTRGKAHSPKSYEDEAADSDEECILDRGSCERPSRVFVRKHAVLRKAHSLSQRHASQHHSCKRSQESSNTVNQPGRSELCEGEMAEDVDEVTDSGLQIKTCQDGPCRDHVTTASDHVSDPGRWDYSVQGVQYSDVKPKRRLQTSLQRQEMLRKVSCGTTPAGYHRQHGDHDHEGDDGDDDEPPFHRERGSNRGEPRC